MMSTPKEIKDNDYPTLYDFYQWNFFKDQFKDESKSSERMSKPSKKGNQMHQK